MRKVTCKCECSFDADLPEAIDIDAEVGTLEAILSGEFLETTCPNCGERLRPELEIRLGSKKRGLDLVVLPELERMTLYRGAASIPKGATVLVGYRELYERARVIADGLDAEAIEIMKYWLELKAEEQSPSGDIAVSYAGIKEGKLVFHVSGLKEGEVAVLAIGRQTYDKTLADKAKTLRESPFDRMLKGPYKSVRALDMDSD
jgi:hypothetical protein